MGGTPMRSDSNSAIVADVTARRPAEADQFRQRLANSAAERRAPLHTLCSRSTRCGSSTESNSSAISRMLAVGRGGAARWYGGARRPSRLSPPKPFARLAPAPAAKASGWPLCAAPPCWRSLEEARLLALPALRPAGDASAAPAEPIVKPPEQPPPPCGVWGCEGSWRGGRHSPPAAPAWRTCGAAAPPSCAPAPLAAGSEPPNGCAGPGPGPGGAAAGPGMNPGAAAAEDEDGVVGAPRSTRERWRCARRPDEPEPGAGPSAPNVKSILSADPALADRAAPSGP
mmetsp:Transcript_43196/g.139241  ORF Transcript_43196/g.139241 Transcript_43196/m.139241 type:complete len:285 (-) Transcript_43196:1-855(-)